MPYKDREMRNAHVKKYTRERYHNDPEYKTRHQRDYRERYHTDPAFRELRLKQAKQWHLSHLDHDKERTHRYWLKLKLEVIQILGGKCVYCGCDDPRALEIHHKNGGGYQEYKSGGRLIQRRIRTGERRIDDLELTCRACNANCNLKRKGVTGITVIWNPPNQES